MPYIENGRRCRLKLEGGPRSTGELNYAITMVVHDYLRRLNATPTYADYNAAIGALECAKLELYRRHVAPYEDVKIKENGDVP